MTLLCLAYYDMTLKASKSAGYLAMVHFDIQLCRMVLAVVAHLQSEPEIRQSLKMWKYVLNHGKASGSII